MNSEQIFRIIFACVFLSMFAISAYHRRQARKQIAQIPRRQESRSCVLLRLLFALPLYGAMLIYLIAPEWMAWAQIPMPAGLRWLGVAVAWAVLPLIYWLFRHIGKNISETVLTKEQQELVASGPYRWVRHPLYTLGTIGLFALGLIAANGFMLVMVLLVAATLPALAMQEERNLIKKFGARYHDYMQRTGRFVPRLTSFRST